MLGEATFAIIGVLFLLTAIRTVFSTLYQSFFGVIPNNTLGGVAIALFAVSALAPLLARAAGPRRSLAGTAAVLGLATVLATVSHHNIADLVLSAIAVVAGLWWLAILHAYRVVGRASPLATALPIAIVADVTMRAALHSEPLVDGPLSTALPLVAITALVFLAAGLASLTAERAWTSPGLRGAIGLVALAPLLMVGETSATNAAQVAAAGGLGLGPEPARSTEIGALFVGQGLAAGAVALARGVRPRAFATAALALGAALLWVHVPALSLAGGALLAAGLFVAASVLPGAPLRPAGSAALSSLALGLGWVGFVVVAFVYHAFFATEAVWIATAFVALACLVVPGIGAVRPRLLTTVAIAAAAVLVPASTVLPLLTSPEPAAPQATFRLMTYNVHQGFDAYDVPSLDALAETIAHEAPDVLVLEEVVRGWVIDDQHDVLSVLSARLGMPYVWQPNVGDLFGNAILSRMPMSDVQRVAYAKEPSVRYQQRGALFVRIADVLIIGTHLDEHADASAIRQEQVRTLLRAWDGAKPVVVAGDLNALPASLELDLLAQAGFADLGLLSGAGDFTFSSDAPHERIDYVWGIGVSASQGHVVTSTASDHRAIVLNITRAGR